MDEKGILFLSRDVLLVRKHPICENVSTVLSLIVEPMKYVRCKLTMRKRRVFLLSSESSRNSISRFPRQPTQNEALATKKAVNYPYEHFACNISRASINSRLMLVAA